MISKRLVAVAALLCVGTAVPPAFAQMPGQPAVPNYEKNLNTPLSYGHYCGVGNSQEGLPPLDALDTACMEHDQCAGNAGLPSCSCHRKFIATTTQIAHDPSSSDLIRKLATNMAAAIAKVPCPDN